MNKYKIQYLSIEKLIVNPDNPRLIKDKQFKYLVKSLKDCPALFDARPCLISDRTGSLIILGGNQRYMAAKELRYKEIPVIIMSGLTEEQEREIAIKDNGEFGEWDFSILANSWEDLPLTEWGINLPKEWLASNNQEEEGDGMVPGKDSNILIRLSFHPGIWLGKREEIITITEKLKKTYNCEVKIEE